MRFVSFLFDSLLETLDETAVQGRGQEVDPIDFRSQPAHDDGLARGYGYGWRRERGGEGRDGWRGENYEEHSTRVI
jgi:hypothetical protein